MLFAEILVVGRAAVHRVWARRGIPCERRGVRGSNFIIFFDIISRAG